MTISEGLLRVELNSGGNGDGRTDTTGGGSTDGTGPHSSSSVNDSVPIIGDGGNTGDGTLIGFFPDTNAWNI